MYHDCTFSQKHPFSMQSSFVLHFTDAALACYLSQYVGAASLTLHNYYCTHTQLVHMTIYTWDTATTAKAICVRLSCITWWQLLCALHVDNCSCIVLRERDMHRVGDHSNKLVIMWTKCSIQNTFVCLVTPLAPMLVLIWSDVTLFNAVCKELVATCAAPNKTQTHTQMYTHTHTHKDDLHLRAHISNTHVGRMSPSSTPQATLRVASAISQRDV